MVVQRYGEDVAGGAEALCRMLAQRMGAQGLGVSVLTTCALDYTTWADELPPGEHDEDGVRVRRLRVPRPRDPSRFHPLSARVLGDAPPPAVVQDAWFREQGPLQQAFSVVLAEEARRHRRIAFFTYLYPPTVLGVPQVSGVRPTVVHPTAHDEVPFRVPMVRRALDLCDGLAYSTEEERELLERRYRPDAASAVLGIGFDPPPPTEPEAFRSAYGLGDRPYVLYLGRIDPNKGADDALAYLSAYRRRRRDDVALVMVGAPSMPVQEGPGVLVTGFVDEQTRWNALAGASALIQPSYQESFSMALAESWLVGRPAIVQRRCDVLAGLARRGGGALTYSCYAEFEACLDLLLEQPATGTQLGLNGREFVLDTYGWEPVLHRYRQLLDAAEQHWAVRRAALDRPNRGPVLR